MNKYLLNKILSNLVLSRVHWVEPRLVAEITYLTWTADNLLRHTVYVGLREDKPCRPGATGELGGWLRVKEDDDIAAAHGRWDDYKQRKRAQAR